MRKRLLFLGLFPALFLLGYVVHAGTGPEIRINEEHFRKLKLGMTLPEVEAIFGVPPGIYHDGPTDIVDRAVLGEFQVTSTNVQHSSNWLGRDGRVFARFDPAGKLQGAYFMKLAPGRESAAQLMERMLGRVFHR
jgi:hypothetical protein